MPEEVVPLAEELEAAIRLAKAAILGRPWVGDRGPELAREFAESARTGGRVGAVLRVGGAGVGIATWAPHGPLGASVHLFYVDPSHAAPETYARFWAGLAPLAGPIVFVPGEIAGLTEAEESALMSGVGFARFGRSEMQFQGDVPPPVGGGLAGALRPVGPADSAELARLHRLAYHSRFDRYLFLEEDDEVADAQRMVRDLFAGRWGAFCPEGSRAVEVDGRLVAAVLSTRRPEGALIADVVVDPALQGKGLGGAVLSAAVADLLGAGIRPVTLNVTEGNDRAARLYERLGFVRTLGPSRDWYDPRRIPFPP